MFSSKAATTHAEAAEGSRLQRAKQQLHPSRNLLGPNSAEGLRTPSASWKTALDDGSYNTFRFNAWSLAPGVAWDFSKMPVFSRDHAGQRQRLALRTAPSRLVIQPKLEVGAVNDPLEREADRAVEQVMRMRDPAAHTAPDTQSKHEAGHPTVSVQRKCSCGGSCDSCKVNQADEEHAKVQRRPDAPKISAVGSSPSATGIAAPPIVHEVLRSPGQPLDAATRAFFEPRFGHDFGRIRVHTDVSAAKSAALISARAYTVGRDLVFAEGQWQPSTADGKKLLAHELAHVMQQVPAGARKAAISGTGSDRESAVGEQEAGSTVVQRQPTKLALKFAGCTPAATMVDDPTAQLATALTFAQDLVDAAAAAIERNDKSANYQTALARHFINPTFEELKTIHRSLRLILGVLKNPENFGCAAGDKDLDECEKITTEGFDEAFTPLIRGVGVGPSLMCAVFFFEPLPCRALTLIHEVAHRIGIGDGGTHPPNRGSAEYPSLAGAPPSGQTTALRMDNPDAYANFAAQIGRETDTDCSIAGPGFMMTPRGAIEIHGNAPKEKR
jgi:hypothetical protein